MSTERPPVARETRKWKRTLLAIGVLVVIAVAALFIPDTLSCRESDPKMTHTIKRGDLVVSVTEQGTLESAVNTEIKCKIRGANIPIIWVIEPGSQVKPGDELVRLETLVFEELW